MPLDAIIGNLPNTVRPSSNQNAELDCSRGCKSHLTARLTSLTGAVKLIVLNKGLVSRNEEIHPAKRPERNHNSPGKITKRLKNVIAEKHSHRAKTKQCLCEHHNPYHHAHDRGGPASQRVNHCTQPTLCLVLNRLLLSCEEFIYGQAEFSCELGQDFRARNRIAATPFIDRLRSDVELLCQML